ncbi:MAG: amino acid permease C-terminal domain-containing protein, partial [Parascardovia denticolens]
ACVFISINLSVLTWIRFLVWLLIGFVVYFGYSYRHAGIRTLEVVDGELDAGASGDASSAESGDAVPAN